MEMARHTSSHQQNQKQISEDSTADNMPTINHEMRDMRRQLSNVSIPMVPSYDLVSDESPLSEVDTAMGPFSHSLYDMALAIPKHGVDNVWEALNAPNSPWRIAQARLIESAMRMAEELVLLRKERDVQKHTQTLNARSRKPITMEQVLADAQVAAAYLRALIDQKIPMPSAVSLTQSYCSAKLLSDRGNDEPREPWKDPDS
jgi:hypothetical protein